MVAYGVDQCATSNQFAKSVRFDRSRRYGTPKRLRSSVYSKLGGQDGLSGRQSTAPAGQQNVVAAVNEFLIAVGRPRRRHRMLLPQQPTATEPSE